MNVATSETSEVTNMSFGTEGSCQMELSQLAGTGIPVLHRFNEAKWNLPVFCSGLKSGVLQFGPDLEIPSQW